MVLGFWSPSPPQLGSFVLALLVLCRIRSIYKLVVVVAATGGVVVEVGIVEVKKVVGDVFFEWWSFGGLTADFERDRETETEIVVGLCAHLRPHMDQGAVSSLVQ